ncbi:hypothetical protein [Sessilibacter sp. MAH4]
MEDILNSIKASLYDRSVSPLFGTICIASLFWNYKIVLTIFSAEKLQLKLLIINQIFKESDLIFLGIDIPGSILDGLLIPFLFSLFYIFIYPCLSAPVYRYSLRWQKKLRDIKVNIEDRRLLTIEESRQINRKLAKLQVEYDNEILSYRRQVETLTEDINRLQKESLISQNNILTEGDQKDVYTDSQSNEVPDEAAKILATFSGLKDGHGRTSEDVAQSLELHIDVVRDFFEHLREKGFIYMDGDTEENDILYMLSPSGRAYLVKNNLLNKYSRQLSEGIDSSEDK